MKQSTLNLNLIVKMTRKQEFLPKMDRVVPAAVIKRQFDHVKVRYRGLKKNTRQLITLFALNNLWMVRSKLMGT